MNLFGLGPTELILIAVLVLIMLIPILLLWQVFGKAGLAPAYSLLVLLPYLGPLIALAILAFVEWPALTPSIAARLAPVSQPPPGVGAPTVPAGWPADPTGAHQLRYWDGSAWTASVHDGGQST